jgi:hypothetical protein
MDEQEFVDEVHRLAGLCSRAETERAVWTTINLLSGQVPSQLRSPLAQLIPGGLGDAVRAASTGPDPGPAASGGAGSAASDDAGPWCVEETPGRIERAEYEDRAVNSPAVNS